MPSQTVDETKTTPSKASVETPKAKPFTENATVDAKALKLWNEGKAKGSKAIFMQAEGVAIFLKAHREEEQGVALATWLKAHMELTYPTATKWDAIHQAKTYLAQLNLPASWTTYYEASRLFDSVVSVERGNVIVKAFRAFTANHLPDEITADVIRKIRVTLDTDHQENITVSDDGKIEVVNPNFDAAKGGVKSMPVLPLKTPAELKDERRKEAEGKIDPTPEQVQAELESELQEFDADGNDVVVTDPKKLFVEMKAEQERFQDLQIRIAMKRVMREFGIKNSEVEIKSKAVAA